MMSYYHIGRVLCPVQGGRPGSVPVVWNGITTGEEGGVGDGSDNGASEGVGSADA